MMKEGKEIMTQMDQRVISFHKERFYVDFSQIIMMDMHVCIVKLKSVLIKINNINRGSTCTYQ